MRDVRSNKLGNVWTLLIWISAVLLLVSSGITYRLLASHLELIFDTPISLPVPLSRLPAQIGNRIGRELPIPATTKEYMEKNFADDFLSRRYINDATGVWADVYIVYCSSRPAGVLGHRPRVCYTGGGWIHDSTESSRFTSASGKQISCLLHRFHKSSPAYEQKVVLNFYILNGRITTDESDFSGPFGRRPNIAGVTARYVAQIQISSVLENSIREAAKDMTDLILDFFPDENAKVKAAESTQITIKE